MRAHKLLRRNEAWIDFRLDHAGICFGGDPISGAMGGGKDEGGDAPDYGPVGDASAYAAKLSKDLGDAQLAENKRQYDQNYTLLKPVADSAAKLQEQAYQQGQKNYDALDKEGRPIQQQMRDYALGAGLSEAHQKQIDEAADKSLADARVGNTQQANMIARQGLRYGWTPEKMAAMEGQLATGNTQSQVAAANAARTGEKDKIFGRMGDVYNTYAGLGSSAPAFYNAGSAAGGTASNVALGTSGQYLNGMSAGNNTIMSGQGLKLSGLGSVMNAQTNVYGASQGGGSPLMGLAGAALGGWAQSGFAGLSDRRAKENIEQVGEYPNGLPKYEFNYIGDPVRYRGVMAQDVEPLYPEAIVHTGEGFMAVNYRALGIEMERV